VPIDGGGAMGEMIVLMPRRTSLPGALVLAAFSLGGCTQDAAPAAPGVDAGPVGPADENVPPQGQRAIEPWLAAGYYKKWTCERDISSPRVDPATPGIRGNHGRHRICSNDLLLGSKSGPYPVGASSVKELFDRMDRPYGYAIGVKVAAGLGIDTWYWYERTGTLATLSPVADGVGDKSCGGDCHGNAARDDVFIRAQ
jgi:hypothetical protein